MGHAVVWLVTMFSATAVYASWGILPALVVALVLAVIGTTIRLGWNEGKAEATVNSSKGDSPKSAGGTFMDGFNQGRDRTRQKQEAKKEQKGK